MTGVIVVGWTDQPDSAAAVRWAAHHARLTDRELLLVHETGSDALAGAAGDDRDENGDQQIVTRLASVVRRLVSENQGLRCDFAIEAEEAGIGLLRWAASSDLLAVGAAKHPQPRLIGSLSDHLAASSDAPVATVPIDWAPPQQQTLVVGATATVAGIAAVRFAAAEASRMRCLLVVVAGEADGTPAARRVYALVQDVADQAILGSAHFVWVEDDVVDALIEHSRGAQLVVVGAHHSTDPWAIRLGPIAQQVLHSAPCTVVTVGRPARLRSRSVEAGLTHSRSGTAPSGPRTGPVTAGDVTTEHTAPPSTTGES